MSVTATATKVLGVVFGPIADYFGKRQERKTKEFELEMQLKTAHAKAAAERLAAGQKRDFSWEIESIKHASWRPGYLTIATTVILALVFIPQTQPFVIEGFESLEMTPYWFQLAVLMVYSSAFGIRVFDAFRKVLNHGK